MLDDKSPLKGKPHHLEHLDLLAWLDRLLGRATNWLHRLDVLLEGCNGRLADLFSDCRFNTEAPNVVHMTVKPQEVVDEDDAKTGKGGGRRDGDEESHAGCRCVIL